MGTITTNFTASFDGSFNPAYPSGGKPSTGYDVYFLIGQSNMIGRPTIRPGIDDDYTTVSGRVFQYGYDSQTVTAATNPLDMVNENAGDMGLWLEFCNTILPSVAADRDILLVPAAQGGTSFAGNNWNPGNTLYNNAMARLASAMTQGAGTNVLKGSLWLQGESDGDAGGVAVTNYQANLQGMLDAMIAASDNMTALTPFIVGSINPATTNYPAINTALQAFAAANAQAQYIDGTDLTFFDAFHYDAPSLETMGARYAGAF